MGVRLLSAVLALVAALVAAAAGARAEPVRLADGRTLQATAVHLRDGRVELTLHVDGGSARVDLPYARVDPDALLALWDAHTDRADAAQVLAGARLALRLDRRAEAVRRFRAVAALDPHLAAEAEAGLTTVRTRDAAQGLLDLETRLRAGSDPLAAAALAAALLEGPQGAGLTEVQRLRVRTLGRLARHLAARAAQPAVVAQAAAAPAAHAPVPPAAAPADDLQEHLTALETQARAAREAAADPDVAPSRARRHLEVAARALLAARRLLRQAPAARQAALAATAERLLDTLVSTWVELADLARQQQDFEAARGCVRAALLLDPGDEAALQQRRFVEEDLRRATEPGGDEGGPGFESWIWSPSPWYVPYSPYVAYPSCRPYAGRAPFGGAGRLLGRSTGVRLSGAGGAWGIWFGTPSRAAPRRVIGRRR